MTQGLAIGVDIGGTNIRAARISPSGEILERLAEKSSSDPELVLQRVIDLVRRLDAPEVSAIGIGIPGRVDTKRKKVLSGGYVDLATVALAERAEQATGKPVFVDNDCNMALVAEQLLGAGRGRTNIVMFTIGTGIGGAIVDCGEILRGRGTGGQLGHIVVDLGGKTCVCGQRGCVETLSSGTAFRHHIAEAGLPASTSVDDLLLARDAGDAVARDVLLAWARPLRAAIDSTVAMFDPDIVLLGGGLGSAAAKALAHCPGLAAWYECDIAPAQLGDDAGMIGAALSALRETAAARSVPSGGKRAVLVNGIPASGKSTVSRGIADRTGWPLLALDTVKNPFLEALGGGDRLFNRTLGRAAYQAIWSAVRDAPAGSTFIVDAWFGFQPLDLLEAHLKMAGVETTVEIWCHAPGEILAERYAARLGQRPAGHPGADYIPELIELAKRAEPLRRGPLIDADTAKAVDLDAMTQTLAAAFADQNSR